MGHFETHTFKLMRLSIPKNDNVNVAYASKLKGIFLPLNNPHGTHKTLFVDQFSLAFYSFRQERIISVIP